MDKFGVKRDNISVVVVGELRNGGSLGLIWGPENEWGPPSP